MLESCHACGGSQQLVIRLIMKTRHCISGCVRVVHSGLWCTHSHETTMPAPLTVIAGPDPRSPSPQEGYPLVVASRHREARSDPFMTDLCKIYFQKKNFISNHLPDSKRLLSTTNVCSTVRSWQTMHLCDIIQTHLIWPKRIHSTKSDQRRFHFLN